MENGCLNKVSLQLSTRQTTTGLYTCNTHATKFRYKAELDLYNEYKEHTRNSVKALTISFTEGLLMDLETDGEVIKRTPLEI